MKFWLILFLLALLCIPNSLHASYDPLSVPNNKFGVHILEPNELAEAAKLVNSSGGDWGYVTVPIRIDDRDFDKWQTFFKKTAQLHIIPIVRLATYPENANWVVPTAYDLVDFANFLNQMPWPTKNRYVILFNEPNHSQEWGGQVDAQSYSTLLLEARSIFKARSEDFFLLTAGLDMSVPKSYTSEDALNFYRQISFNQPDWYEAVDGLSVHAYPNPGYLSSPFSQTRFGISSYHFETNTLQRLGYSTTKPIFITETGTLNSNNFYPTAFNEIWTDESIVAVTPFILFAGAGDFTKFSLLDTNHQPTLAYRQIFDIPKVVGSPLLANPEVQPTGPSFSSNSSPAPARENFFSKLVKFIFPPTPKVSIRDVEITVEIAETSTTRSKGLSNRNQLSANHGMLFIFPDSQVEKFWMKDMKFALDYIWIDAGKIVKISENVLPPSQTKNIPTILSSDKPVNQVLEVSAGFVSKHGLQVGDAVYLTR